MVRVCFLVFFYLFVALFTTLSYRIIKPGWITYTKASSLLENKMYDEALACYIEAIDQGIDSLYLSKYLTKTLDHCFDFNHPTKLLEILISRHSRNSKSFKFLGNFFAEHHDYKSAAKTYNYLLTLFPEDRYARFELAQVLSRQGKYEEAIEEYKLLLDEKL